MGPEDGGPPVAPPEVEPLLDPVVEGPAVPLPVLVVELVDRLWFGPEGTIRGGWFPDLVLDLVCGILGVWVAIVSHG